MAKSISYLYNQFWHSKVKPYQFSYSSITLLITLFQYNYVWYESLNWNGDFLFLFSLLCYLFHTNKRFDCNLDIQIKTTVEPLFFFSKLVKLLEMNFSRTLKAYLVVFRIYFWQHFCINDRYNQRGPRKECLLTNFFPFISCFSIFCLMR